MGMERLRGVKCTLYKEAAAYIAGIQIWRTALQGHCDEVYEMGLTGNHFVSLLLYILVVNEIRLPLVSLWFFFLSLRAIRSFRRKVLT